MVSQLARGNLDTLIDRPISLTILIITGLVVCFIIVTNGGVASTVRDAHMRYYHTLVLKDDNAASMIVWRRVMARLC